ncbi:Good for full DBP5 activity protein 2 [Grifola frondosa]|uniref:Good for full DBP5 activity protein 2 n=1 Tax=Grifola frondosa TaxID=5627 RepID=A0A1C7LZT8_GRIFR|nr:Good for full DBP5 activity protein 2 [Grifola frondosa]
MVHQALKNQEDKSPLKALIAYEALVHPDHPLRKPNVDGIELYIGEWRRDFDPAMVGFDLDTRTGTFENGAMRLLFSSAQVEYLRYYLYTVQLTKEPIGLPSRTSDLSTVTPNVYNDAAVLKKAIKTIDKNNRRLKGADSLLAARRLAFERTRTLWSKNTGAWLSVDFEAWDRDHTMLTEFGYSLVYWDKNEEVRERGHFIVKEHRGYTNTYVPEHRNDYNFGRSEEVNKKAFKQRICDLITKHRNLGPLFLVFHDYNQDIKYLRSESVNAISQVEFLLPETAQEKEVYIVDTADMFAALEGDTNQKRSLERVCRHLQIPTMFLHNAGNDAHYTLLSMISMASGGVLDEAAREALAEPDWEEDSDFSDMEGVVPMVSKNEAAHSIDHMEDNMD